MTVHAGAPDKSVPKEKIRRTPFAEWLVTTRQERGWSQDDVAAHANADLTQGYVSSLERDVRRPSRDMVRTIAKALYAGEECEAAEYARFEARAMEAAGYLAESSGEPSESLQSAIYDYVKRTGRYDNLRPNLTPEEFDRLLYGASLAVAGYLDGYLDRSQSAERR
jgi:transcriptional regulator with XRE-family HTH domain